MLNISTVAGKESKLLLVENKLINKHRPPFLKRSFVKLDSLTHISIQEAQAMRLLDNGQTLDAGELYSIKKAL